MSNNVPKKINAEICIAHVKLIRKSHADSSQKDFATQETDNGTNGPVINRSK